MNATRKPWQGKLPRLTGRALQKRNERIKLRDGYTCAGCGRITDQVEIDHIMPLSKGGSDTDDKNLQLLCVTPDGTGCHARKTAKEKGCKRVGCDEQGNPLGGWPA